MAANDSCHACGSSHAATIIPLSLSLSYHPSFVLHRSVSPSCPDTHARSKLTMLNPSHSTKPNSSSLSRFPSSFPIVPPQQVVETSMHTLATSILISDPHYSQADLLPLLFLVVPPAISQSYVIIFRKQPSPLVPRFSCNRLKLLSIHVQRACRQSTLLFLLFHDKQPNQSSLHCSSPS